MKKTIFLLTILLTISAFSSAQRASLSPLVRQAMMQYRRSVMQNEKQTALQNGEMALLNAETTQQGRRVVGSNDNIKNQQTITALVKTDDVNVLKDNGCKIYSSWDNIYAASIPLSRLDVLARDSHVKRIEAGKPCEITLDTTRTKVNADAMRNAPRSNTDVKGYTGRGVIVGVQDIGFDLTHPTFRTADGKHLRIKALWDQLSTDTLESQLPVGRDYKTEEELMALMHSYDGTTQNHGTHTSGAAAGNGREDYASIGGKDVVSHYIGLAPDADIVLSANYTGNNKDLVPQDIRYKYTTATDILGFQYIFDYADSIGKPCVINFSEGAHDDLYENGLYRDVLNTMVGPGRIICASAGNQAYKGSYIHKALGEKEKGAFLISSSHQALYVMSSTKPVEFQLSFYSQSGDKKDWRYSCEGLSEYPDSVFTDTLSVGDYTYEVMLQTYPSCNDETLFATDLLLTELHGYGNWWRVHPTAFTLLDENNDIEAFNAGGYFTANAMNPDLADFTYDHNINFPACMENVICVGGTAYVTCHINYKGELMVSNNGVNGERMSYSSMGPTLSGLTKPDVMAPGNDQVSAFNAFYLEKNPEANDVSWNVRNFDFEGRKYAWNSNSGTSMAAPVVTGIVACWLELCPTLSPQQLKEVFANTCSHYDESLDYPNNQYGYGQIDAMKGIEFIQKNFTGIEDVMLGEDESAAGSNVIYNLNGIRVSPTAARNGIFIMRKNNRMVKILW